ncbi:hypothetical protein SteCoe_20804 [Stentor coeruleus]|uniref:Uncharacterized protein n=1 Tax=Stentor coeruleus TaxID=5963 RepID=A0A1R2BRI7_9CILI|nr:hypothetical protein SteCoe_20804 [Stentor coeruleus]
MDAESQPPAEIFSIYLVHPYHRINYIWRIRSVKEDFPKERSLALDGVTMSFTQEFFAQGRNQHDNIKRLGKDLISTFHRFVSNIPINDNEFLNQLENEYNIFHSKVQDMQIEKINEVLEYISKRYILKKEYRSFFGIRSTLDEKKAHFAERMFMQKVFTADIFKEEFFSHFSDFIAGIDEQMKRNISDNIEIKIREFARNFEILMSEKKNVIIKIITDIRSKVDPIRLSVMKYEYNGDLDAEIQQKTQWEIVYEDIINNEELDLKQIIGFADDFVLITIGLKKSLRLMIITSKNYVTRALPNFFPDNNTVIASGSNEHCTILMQNTLNRAFIGCLSDDRFIISKEITIYSEIVKEISSAAYIQSNKELFIINTSGNFSAIKLGEKPLSDSRHVVPTTYRNISASLCQRFIVLISISEVYVFSYNLQLIYQEYTIPYYAGMRGNKFDQIFMTSINDISGSTIELDAEKRIPIGGSQITMSRIDAEYRRTIRLAADIFSVMLRDQNFAQHESKRINPRTEVEEAKEEEKEERNKREEERKNK